MPSQDSDEKQQSILNVIITKLWSVIIQIKLLMSFQFTLGLKAVNQFLYANELHYKCNKTSLNCDGSYINFLEWQKDKNAAINPNNNDVFCMQ